LRAAATAGVPTLRPVTSGTFGPQLYRDAGFHLNPAGATIFTERLIPVLRRELDAALARDARRAGDTVTRASIPLGVAQ
jgi:hypothetical protein